MAVAGRLHGSDHTLMRTNRSQQRKQISARRCVPTAVWVTDCLSIQTAHSTNGSLCLDLGRGTKGQLKCVCVRWLQHSTAFSPPRSIHTQIQGYWHPGTVKSHKRTKKKTQHGRTQGAWESFWPLPREKGGAQTPWGEKRAFSWVRLKKILKHSEPKYQLTYKSPCFCLLACFFKKSTHWERKFWPHICHSRGILYQDIFFFWQTVSQLCRHSTRYLAVKLLHCYQVQGLEWMAWGGNEIKAGVESRVVVVVKGALDFQLLLQVAFKLPVDVVHHWLVAARQANVVDAQLESWL